MKRYLGVSELYSMINVYQGIYILQMDELIDSREFKNGFAIFEFTMGNW